MRSGRTLITTLFLVLSITLSADLSPGASRGVGPYALSLTFPVSQSAYIVSPTSDLGDYDTPPSSRWSFANLPPFPNWTAEGAQNNAYFGHEAATAGDVNGDGYGDVIVGAPYYENGELDEGAAFVYYGSSVGLSSSPDWIAEGNQQLAYFGWSVAPAGDVNDDGYDDVIVGAYNYDGGEAGEGRAYLYYGSLTGLSTIPGWTFESDQGYANLGWSAASAGDVNKDGYDDVVVGAPFYDNGEDDEGQAYVFYGSTSGLPPTPSWTAESDQGAAFFGFAASTAGDVNGDNYDDLIVGAYGYDNPLEREGRAYVFFGSDAGLSSMANWTAESDQAGSCFSIAVGTAGDVNDDGYDEVIVGAYLYDRLYQDEGSAFLYNGSPVGPSLDPDWSAEGGQTWAFFGFAVGTAGDVDGDGYAEVIVGAHAHDGDELDEGRAYLYGGSSAGLSTTPTWSAGSDQGGAHFGRAVATAGDVNKDGYGDAIVGASSYDNGETDEGRVFVYHGTVADLELGKHDSNDPTERGSLLTYTLSVTNSGPHTTTAVIVTDTLPAGCTFIDAWGSGWTCIHAAGSITCTRPKLAVEAAPSIAIVVTVPSISGTITNTAGVSSATTDPDRSDNSAVEGTVIACFPVVAPTFSWWPLTPRIDQVITFTGSASGTEPLTFTWDLGDGTAAGGTSVSHVYTRSREYHVIMTAGNPCGWRAVSRTIQVYDPPPPQYRLSLPLVLRYP